MNWLLKSHRIGSIFGFEVRIAYSLYVFIALMALPSLLHPWPLNLTGVAILLLPLFVFFHELGHSFAARAHGVAIEDITLHPLGGAARLRGLIPGPIAEIKIALAGPAASLGLATALYILPLLSGSAMGGMFFLQSLAWLNLLLALFNMIPIFPMDGGRVAMAALVASMGPDRGIDLMRPIALAGTCILGLIGIAFLLNGSSSGIFLICIAVFLYVQGQQELQARFYMNRYLGSQGIFSSPPLYTSTQRPAAEPGWFSRWSEVRATKRREIDRKQKDAMNNEVDRILAKVNETGTASLTPKEKALLNKASKMYRDERKF